MCEILGSSTFVTSEKWGRPSAQFRDIRPVFQSPGGRGGKMEIKEGSKHISSALYNSASMVRYLTNLPSTRMRNWLSSKGSTLAWSTLMSKTVSPMALRTKRVVVQSEKEAVIKLLRNKRSLPYLLSSLHNDLSNKNGQNSR